ncbi:hypothetical protein [Labrenzia sp. PHM005]|uniref:hypothetical protein n=1 Tax=Labrenzia sp. PHM005 TaxID=2590016 RepID=UPI0011402BC6|nr:hypothetical protein [Labrenzia sp. PHM005]QDG78562.1 hypothetical protein FJ695_23365 [Labrenzia sp. PHM005]
MVSATVDEILLGSDIAPDSAATGAAFYSSIVNTPGAIVPGSDATGGYIQIGATGEDVSPDAYRSGLQPGREYIISLTINGVPNDFDNRAGFTLADPTTGQSLAYYNGNNLYRGESGGSTIWTEQYYRWETNSSVYSTEPIIVVYPRGETASYTLSITDTTLPVVTAVTGSSKGSLDETTLLRDAPDGTSTDPAIATIVVTDTIYGSTQGAYDTDAYLLNVEAGKEYVIELLQSDVGNTFASGTNTSLFLKDMDGNTVGTTAQTGTSSTLEKVTFTAENTETLMIQNWFRTFNTSDDAATEVNYYRLNVEEVSGTTDPGTDPSVATQVFRFFNTVTGTHFFTSSETERDSILSTLPHMTFEGAAFGSNATASDGVAVYRLLNTATGSHFYTANFQEWFDLVHSNPAFNDEGISYYAYTSASDSNTPLYRFYNTQTGTHVFTASDAERDNIISTLPQFNYEGVAYYVDLV